MLGWQARVTYDDDCFAFVTGLRQDYTDYRDIESGFEITFNVVFKTLGDIPIDVF